MLSKNIICITEKCPHRKVCKHFEYLNSLEAVNVSIESCEHLPELTPMSVTTTTPIIDKIREVAEPYNPNIGTTPYIKPTMPDTITTPNYPPYTTNPYMTKPREYNDRDFITSYTYTGEDIPQTFKSKAPLNVTAIKVSKGICSICGKTAYTENCSDCGNVICNECGYTNVDVNDGKPIITCDKCFGASDKNNESTETISWDINEFSEESKKEETKDEQSKIRKKSSHSKSKK